MLAAVPSRPESWDLPLFLHVLGATLTFGATATIAVLAFAGRRVDERALWLRRLAFWIGFVILVPAWFVMRAGASWIDGKEFPDHEPGWVGVGYVVSEGGALLIIIMLVLAWIARRKIESRAAAFVPWLASIYLVALGVAWFAMTGKPGS